MTFRSNLLERLRRERWKAEMGYDHEDGPWEETPKWHPYRWLFRCDIRRWVDYNPWDGAWWEYGRSRKVAHELLRNAYATDVDPKEIKR